MLCTDGLANVGVGALDDLKTDEEREAAEKLYAEVGLEVRYRFLDIIWQSPMPNMLLSFRGVFY